MSAERRACGICKSFYDEASDQYRIAAHLDEASAVERAGRALAGSISLREVADMPNAINCPCLRAIVQTAADLILDMAAASRKRTCAVVTPTAAEILRRSLDKTVQA